MFREDRGIMSVKKLRRVPVIRQTMEKAQRDGSHHNWFEGRGSRCVRMASIDEASSRV